MSRLKERATRIWLTREESRRKRDRSDVPDGEPRPRKRGTKWRIPLLSPALNTAVIVGGGLVLCGIKFVPEPAKVYPLERTQDLKDKRQLVLLADDGTVFAHRGGCTDAPVRRAELPQHLVDALVSMEDRRFYMHFGIDPKGILRAAKRNMDAHRIVEGGSTITQQLAKLSYLTREKTLERKLEEFIIVLRLELLLTKDQILERYLNAAYFGQGCHGLRAAVRHYFKKPVSDMSVSESALLIALLRSPSKLTRDRDAARERQQLVLNAMVETGRLSPDQRASTEPVQFKDTADDVFGAYYADWIAQTLELPDDGETAPLKVQTSFNPKLQELAEAAVETILKKAGTARKASQAALVAMRPDGRILAMVGGRDYASSQFNRAYHAARQPGSAFKTFVYLAALRQGATPQMEVWDEPISIGDWSPKNFGQNYSGLVTLERAFASSINTVAVRLSETVGRDNVIGAAHDLGITSALSSTPSIALGTSEVNLVELTSAYAAIAANAYPIRPWGVRGVGENSDAGAPPTESGTWKLMAGDSLRNLLATTVSQGTARGARIPIAAYGKTGTSQDFRDAWFIGFAGNLVVGVWVGNDDNSSMRGVTGGSLPASIWRQFMMQARKGDRNFTSRLTTVAAFAAKERYLPTDTGAALASLLLAPQDERMDTFGSYDGWWGLWGGRRDRATLFGDDGRYGRYDERRYERYQRDAPRAPSRRNRRILEGDGGA